MNSESKEQSFLARLQDFSKRNRVPLPRIVSRLCRLRWVDGYDPTEAFISGLLDPSVPAQVSAGCVSKRRLIRLQGRHNPAEHWRETEDKGVFYRRCLKANIAIPGLCGILDEGDGWLPEGGRLRSESEWEDFLRDRVKGDFVVKPSFGAHGTGVRVYARNGRGYLEPSGAERSASDILKELRSDKAFYRFVIQPRVRNHSRLEELSGSSYLQTIRVVTYVDPGGKADAYMAAMKVIVGKNSVDNIMFGRSGNIAGTIDMEKGRLVCGVTINPDRMGLTELDRHPVTGVPFASVQLPWWSETLGLARLAAIAFHPLRTIGWDIALTPTGPMIIEGNMWWDPMNIHMASQPGAEAERGMISLLRRLETERVIR